MIKIKRLQHSVDYHIPYRVLIDGKVVMELKDNDFRDYALQEGEHTIKIVSDEYVSEPIKFQIFDGQIIEFECQADHGPSKTSKVLRKIFLGKVGIRLQKKNDFYL